MSAKHDLAMQIRYDLTAAQSKLTELLRMIGEEPDDTNARVPCPTCGLSLKGLRTLAEHVHTSHDGPMPDHWVETQKHDIWASDDPAYLEGMREPETEVTA